MNNLKILMMLSFLSIQVLQATGDTPICTNMPTTTDLANPELANNLPAVKILTLQGKNCANLEIKIFEIVSLPSSESGVLYLNDCITQVSVGEILNEGDSKILCFNPKESFVGNSTFTYRSIDFDGSSDVSPATVTTPIVSPVNNPTTKDILLESFSNTVASISILALSGVDNNDNKIEKFIITTLPDVTQGTLFLEDCTTRVTIGQELNAEQSSTLCFIPNNSFVGNTTFTYASIDVNGNTDATPATVTIPLIAGNGVCVEEPITDDKLNNQILNTLGATDILSLSGKDCNNAEIKSFIIKTLPTAEEGILYMADGVTAVIVNQVLTLEEANGLRFDPVDGFVGNATFTYASIDVNGNTDATPATVTIPLTSGNGVCVEEPITDDKLNNQILNTLAATDILSLSGKDCNNVEIKSFIIKTLPTVEQGVLYMADGVTSVTLDQVLTLEEANGLKFDPVDGFIGNATFTYASIDTDGNTDTTPATVTIPLTDVLPVTDIVTNPDTGIAHGNADPITINVLANDTGDLNGSRVHLINADGTLTDRIVVEGEGIWNVNPDNTITFTPVAPFVGTPSPVNYLVEDANGARSNPSVISIAGQCVCSAYEESVPTLSVFSLFLLFVLTPLLGIFLMRKEEFKSNL